MITIEWGRSNLNVPYSANLSTVKEINDLIKSEQINLQDATITIRCKIPGIAFEGIVGDVVGSGGKIL